MTTPAAPVQAPTPASADAGTRTVDLLVGEVRTVPTLADLPLPGTDPYLGTPNGLPTLWR